VSCLFFEGSYRYLRVHRYIAAYCVYRGRATILKYRGTGSRETILADHYYTYLDHLSGDQVLWLVLPIRRLVCIGRLG
jgi:hypothetical protein